MADHDRDTYLCVDQMPTQAEPMRPMAGLTRAQLIAELNTIVHGVADQAAAMLEADADVYVERDRLRVALQLIASAEDAPDLEVEGDARSGLHCGVEDRDLRDRYDGADFGYTVGAEKTLEWARNEANAALKGEA